MQQLLAHAAGSALTRPRGWGKATANHYLHGATETLPDRVAAVQHFVLSKSRALQQQGQKEYECPESLVCRTCDPVVLLSELLAAVRLPRAETAGEDEFESQAACADAALASARARETALQQLEFSKHVRAEYESASAAVSVTS